MTLSQLRAFALVARLGSVRAAAAALRISEPAVSSAIAALRADLGDPLFVRSGMGIALTLGGRALADHAQEIVGLADQVRWEVAHADTMQGRLRVLATPAFAEHAAGRLLDAFAKRMPGPAVDVVVEAVADVRSLLLEHVYDVALGARPQMGAGPALEIVPILRYQRVFVAGAGHPLAAWPADISLTVLRAQQWFAGPAGIEEFTEEARRVSVFADSPDIVRLTSENDALAAVRAGEGIMLALSQVVQADIAAGTLVALGIAGTPISGLWFASMLAQTRSGTAAQSLQRFATTAEATAAMLAPGGSRGLERRGSKVHVALWS